MILVEHESERLLCVDRLLVMNQGRIVADDSPEKILADPELCSTANINPPQIFDLFSKLGLAERPGSVEQAAELLKAKGYSAKGELPPLDQNNVGAPLIELSAVTHEYSPGRPALNQVDLEIHEGQFVALLGQNGSGKTTLVKHLNALLRPTSGLVRFRNKDILGLGPAKMGRKVGFVFQNPDHMLFAATVREEVAFTLTNMGLDKKQIDDRSAGALATVGLTGFEDVDPFVMTKGQRQQLAVASVLAAAPEVLILDEPTTGLDAKDQRAMMEILFSLNRAGHTIVIITHTLDVAAAYARRAVLIHDGRVLADGSMRDIMQNQALLKKTGLSAPPALRLGTLMGAAALTVDELAACLKREKE